MSTFSKCQTNSENHEALVFARSLCEAMSVPNSGISGISFVYQIRKGKHIIDIG